jgi:hypothetical protein
MMRERFGDWLPSRAEVERTIEEERGLVRATVFHPSGFVHGETDVGLSAEGLPESVWVRDALGELRAYPSMPELFGIQIGARRFQRHWDGG